MCKNAFIYKRWPSNRSTTQTPVFFQRDTRICTLDTVVCCIFNVFEPLDGYQWLKFWLPSVFSRDFFIFLFYFILFYLFCISLIFYFNAIDLLLFSINLFIY